MSKRKYKYWTESDVEFLKQNVNKLDDWELAEALGRTRDAVVHYKQRHRILQSHDFTAHIISLARGGSGTPMSPAEKFRAYVAKHGRKAKDAVFHAKAAGRLVEQPCEICNSAYCIAAHHANYDRPLEVRWLCARCHRRLHRRTHAKTV